MGAEKIIKKGVDVKINGAPHKIRFTMGALAHLAEKHGSVNKVMEIFQGMTNGTLGLSEINAMADLLYAGLMHEGGELTREWIMETMDVAEMVSLTPQLVEAFVQSMGLGGGTPGKANPPKA